MIEGFILALVIEKSSYAYEIHHRLRKYADIVSTSLSNIYDVLKRLEEAGYVAVAGQSGARGKPRINYQATDEGMAIHLAWIGDFLRDPERCTVVLRLASASLRQPEAKLKLIDSFVEDASREASQIAMPELDDELGDLFVELRRRVADATLQWAVYARSRVSKPKGVG